MNRPDASPPAPTPSVPPTDEASSPPVKSIAKALRLLQAVADKPACGASFSELLREQGLGKATTHRLLAALAESGFVTQDPGSRHYGLGQAARLLGRHALDRHLTSAAQAYAERIAEHTQDTAFAALPEGKSAVCIARALGSYPIRSLAWEPGARRPLGVGAASLALLAAMDDTQLERVLTWNTEAYADYPGFDATLVRQLVEQTRDQGYAFNQSHVVQGMNAIGVAVCAPDGQPLLALSVSAITERISGVRRNQLVRIVQDEAARLTRELATAR